MWVYFFTFSHLGRWIFTVSLSPFWFLHLYSGILHYFSLISDGFDVSLLDSVAITLKLADYWAPTILDCIVVDLLVCLVFLIEVYVLNVTEVGKGKWSLGKYRFWFCVWLCYFLERWAISALLLLNFYCMWLYFLWDSGFCFRFVWMCFWIHADCWVFHMSCWSK